MAQEGQIDVVLVEFTGRLARFGYRYIEEYLSAFGVRLVCLDPARFDSSEEDLTKDLITIVTVFWARLYGKRSHGFRQRVTAAIQEHHAERG